MSDKTPSGRRKANKAKVKGYVTENRRTDTYVQYDGLLAIIYLCGCVGTVFESAGDSSRRLKTVPG